MSDHRLSVRGVTVRYGGIAAISDVSLDLGAGSISGLIGPNGAGKTSFLDAVSGFTPMSRGSVSLEGRRIDAMAPEQSARLGLARTFQSLELFDDLSVADNLRVPLRRPRWSSLVRDAFWPARPSGREQAALSAALELCGLVELAASLPLELSNGERHRVALARAVAAQPSVLLLDEPAAGLDPGETDELSEVLSRLAATGMALLLVDHDMALVMGCCSTVHVLDRGTLIASGSPDVVRQNSAVVQAYLGVDPR